MADTYKVKAGDTLSGIALKYLGSASKYKQLAAINDIDNPNYIYVGQVIKLKKDSSSSDSSSGSTGNTNTNKTSMGIIKHFGQLSDPDNPTTNTVFAAWKWDKKNTKNYKYIWYYAMGFDEWYKGDEGETENKISTYNIPTGATKIKFKVKPISKTRKVNGKSKPYFKAQNWSTSRVFNVNEIPPEAPGAPNVEMEKGTLKLVASLDNLDTNNATHVQFHIIRDDVKTVEKSSDLKIVTRHAEFSCVVAAGHEYKVRARVKKGNVYSEWSEYSENKGTIPATISKISELYTKTKTSVYISWPAIKTATTYEIQYTTEKRYFDTADNNVSKTTVDAKVVHHAEITGIDAGDEYFFRVRAVNDEGESGWSPIKSVLVGRKPSAPTTWSSSTTVIVGEPLHLYWVHNSEDGSSQTYAELELTIDGVKGDPITIKNSTDEDLKDKTSVYDIDTNKYKEGSKIEWRVRTRGAILDYSDWSIQRTIDIYAKPYFETFELKDANGDPVEVLTEFPLYIEALAGPTTQVPTGYHVTITANESYETEDDVGNIKMVKEGDEVYSKYFDIDYSLNLELGPDFLDLESGISYTVTCVVSMNSGLTAQVSEEFEVSWLDYSYIPDAEVYVDTETLTASIRPYAEWFEITKYKVELVDGVYTKTDEIIEFAYGEIVEGALTTTDEEVYFGMNELGEEIYFCNVERTVDIEEDVTLSVYRREFDGTFTELATGIANGSYTYITDPHPALDYARYRIIARTESTGAVRYSDIPAEPVGEHCAVIQWDEAWRAFDTTEEAELDEPPWTGNMIKIPYNIDVADSNSADVSLVEYIGRKHPVAYYGTQLGTKSSWKMEIPKDDTETLYALRRLAIWMGDVYVREPSGSGYWANISVSFSQTHCELTIPISISVVRVEGGI